MFVEKIYFVLGYQEGFVVVRQLCTMQALTDDNLGARFALARNLKVEIGWGRQNLEGIDPDYIKRLWLTALIHRMIQKLHLRVIVIFL